MVNPSITQLHVVFRAQGEPPISTFNPALVVRLSGPAVGPGRVAVRDLAELSRYLEQALRRIAQVISREKPPEDRPNARAIEKLCRLYLVCWGEGSATVGFDVAEPPPGLTRFGRLGETAVDLLLSGLSQFSTHVVAKKGLPRGFSGEVLETCAALGKLLERGIDEITFGRAAPDRREPTVTYNTGMREHFAAMAARQLRSAGVHEYSSETLASGSAIRGADLDIPQHREGSFWRAVPLDELAAEQATAPLSSLGELDAIWSEGEVFDDALSDLLHDRRERRRRNEGRAE